jgi:hypothetical protein
MIPETPTGNYSKPDDFEYDDEGSNTNRSVSKSNDMEDHNDHNEERGNPPRNNQPWLSKYALEIPR